MPVEILGFLVFAASQVGTPGPANMALLATGAGFGLRPALPFVAGVALGKQLIIWPIGFGLMTLADTQPWLFVALKWASVAYIFWLAYKVAFSSLKPGQAGDHPPGFASGLFVHPLNPKAWAMILTGFTSFTDPSGDRLEATAIIAICLLSVQAILHPLWTWGGARLARHVVGSRYERLLMFTLAGLTVVSVIYVLILGR
ncbi:MAG: threonine/homoserine/homoserine lactone efflux protein [Paracoccaceae bacterium]|jgi:threonine/homoserine/homoserine lactone efflux protein